MRSIGKVRYNSFFFYDKPLMKVFTQFDQKAEIHKQLHQTDGSTMLAVDSLHKVLSQSIHQFRK